MDLKSKLLILLFLVFLLTSFIFAFDQIVLKHKYTTFLYEEDVPEPSDFLAPIRVYLESEPSDE